MAMRFVESEFRRMGNPGAAKAVAGLREEMSPQLRTQYGADDIPLPGQPTPAKKDKPQDVLALAVREFKASPLTPELVTKTFQTIWQVRGESAGVEVVIPPCDRSAEELVELVKAGRRIGYLPEQVMTQESRPLFAKMFPRLGSHSVQEGNSVTNEANRFGWFDYEVSVDAPYLDTTEDQLKERIAADGRLEMNVSEYIVAGEDSKLFTGKFLDQGNTWARLLGSRYDDEVVNARFASGGDLDVDRDLFPQDPHPLLGGRSVGVKSA